MKIQFFLVREWDWEPGRFTLVHTSLLSERQLIVTLGFWSKCPQFESRVAFTPLSKHAPDLANQLLIYEGKGVVLCQTGSEIFSGERKYGADGITAG